MNSDQWIGLIAAIPTYLALRYILRKVVSKWRARQAGKTDTPPNSHRRH
jgi:biopolymer transport protein ExbB/TolQ